MKSVFYLNAFFACREKRKKKRFVCQVQKAFCFISSFSPNNEKEKTFLLTVFSANEINSSIDLMPTGKIFRLMYFRYLIANERNTF